MRFFRPLLILFALTGGLVGVAAYAGPLSTDPEYFDYVPLPLSGWSEARITDASPRFEFKSGVSPYAAFKLPVSTGRYLVDIISMLDPPSDPLRSRVFYPSLALLSEGFLVIRSSQGPSWRFDIPEYAQTVAPGYRVTVEVDQGGPERYLVVYTQNADAAGEWPGAADQGRLLIKVTPRADE